MLVKILNNGEYPFRDLVGMILTAEPILDNKGEIVGAELDGSYLLSLGLSRRFSKPTDKFHLFNGFMGIEYIVVSPW